MYRFDLFSGPKIMKSTDPPQDCFLFHCDHLFSGNACCPCGQYQNNCVKSVCTIINGKQYWFKPYGEKGLPLDDAVALLKHKYPTYTYESDKCLAEVLWDHQMINGVTYLSLKPSKKGSEQLK